MRLIVVLFLAGCVQRSPVGPRLGDAHAPYRTQPAYFQHPVAEHELAPVEKIDRVGELLRDIDTRAGVLDDQSLPEQQQYLRQTVEQLDEVVPPKPELLEPVDRLRNIVDEMPRNPPDLTRRRLWALTDLMRLRF